MPDTLTLTHTHTHTHTHTYTHRESRAHTHFGHDSHSQDLMKLKHASAHTSMSAYIDSESPNLRKDLVTWMLLLVLCRVV
jgi:hypothetical protein